MTAWEHNAALRCIELDSAIDRALEELGVPGPGYPAPVANAIGILSATRIETEEIVPEDEPPRPDLDLAYTAWTIIANVSEGDWSKQTAEWQAAAARWRDEFHTALALTAGREDEHVD